MQRDMRKTFIVFWKNENSGMSLSSHRLLYTTPYLGCLQWVEQQICQQRDVQSCETSSIRGVLKTPCNLHSQLDTLVETFTFTFARLSKNWQFISLRSIVHHSRSWFSLCGLTNELFSAVFVPANGQKCTPTHSVKSTPRDVNLISSLTNRMEPIWYCTL